MRTVPCIALQPYDMKRPDQRRCRKEGQQPDVEILPKKQSQANVFHQTLGTPAPDFLARLPAFSGAKESNDAATKFVTPRHARPCLTPVGMVSVVDPAT